MCIASIGNLRCASNERPGPAEGAACGPPMGLLDRHPKGGAFDLSVCAPPWFVSCRPRGRQIMPAKEDGPATSER